MAEPIISVSRETLRAELGELKHELGKALVELELRLIDRFEAALAQKADRARVDDMANRLSALELTTLKREGPVVSEINRLHDRVGRIEFQHEQDRPLLTTTAEHVDGLRSWRNRLVGGFLLCSALAALVGLRAYFGIG